MSVSKFWLILAQNFKHIRLGHINEKETKTFFEIGESMKKFLIVILLIFSPVFFSCSDTDNNDDISYQLKFKLTRISDSVVVADDTYTAGPNETGHEGLPAASLYTSGAGTADDQYVFLVSKNTLDYAAVEDIIGGWSLSNDGIWFSTSIGANGPGTYTFSVINSKINGVEYNITTSETGQLVITEVGGAGTGTMKGTFSAVVKDGSTQYTLSGSFTVKRGADDTHMTN